MKTLSLLIANFILIFNISPLFAEGEQSMSTLDTLRIEIPKEVADKIREQGNTINRRGVLQAMTALYAQQPRIYDKTGIEVDKNIAYGPDPSHQLDVHTVKQHTSKSPVPVVIFIHGGGFVSGNRELFSNIPNTFAYAGLVGVNATYRLAPAHKWPAGTEDVAAVVKWVHNNIEKYGGDPKQIFIIGHSAGAFHVAAYVYRIDVIPPDTPQVAGAILASGPYIVNPELQIPGAAAYFGLDTSKWNTASFDGNIKRTDIPVFITVAELEPPLVYQNFAFLIDLLIMKHNVMPRFAYIIGHNHVSYPMSVGTQDMSFTKEVLDFINQNTTSSNL